MGEIYECARVVSGHKGERNCAPIPAITQTVKGEGGGEAGGRARAVHGGSERTRFIQLEMEMCQAGLRMRTGALTRKCNGNGSCWVV